MVNRPQTSRVGLVLFLAAAVAVATSFWLPRVVPLSGGTSSSGAPPRVEHLPSADPVSDRSPVARQACDQTGNGIQPRDGTSESEPKLSTRSAATRHRNDAGGYEFLAPPTWKVREQGPISKLVGPGRDLVVSLGPGPAGGLPHAYDEFAELLGKTYGNVRFGKIDARCAAGDLSVWRHGKGTNAAAEPFEFLAVIIERSSGGAVGAFGAWNPNVPQVRPLIHEVMKSFRAISVRA